MKTSRSTTTDQVCCPWPTPVQTPTVLNSSSPPFHAHGWTVSMLSLVKLLTVTTSLRRLSPWVLLPVPPRLELLLPSPVNYNRSAWNNTAKIETNYSLLNYMYMYKVCVCMTINSYN
ncbi:hypothetical protein NG271_413 [Saccharomyces cerevisiae synthetic construct]|uniref:Putative uncharacterized protein YDR154C n=2 Tax=Saccharomyces cerevisiae TaxID=4932 RepID=YD154_YEAST|nr:RecName: Full=Putative uncharacterized protein YDR154C [Saccharomyces cerevisiae S288C]AHX39261.1 hypothetical protein YDR154C [Saccharomyces cerevisiae]WNF19969.1 hypothetical protein NG271_413 [Saccharomyces cerevisiae synthetic construct]CAY78658.1 EC1118_1D0_4126p [Saccharomyces cerevisiae EC1118]